MRNLKFHVSRCYPYEFEDLISTFDTADLILPTFSPNLFKFTNGLANSVVKSTGIGKFLNPTSNQISVDREYELFFAIFQSASDILSLNSVKGWRKKCHKAICLLDEVWAKDVGNWKGQLEILSKFDYIFLNLSLSVQAVNQIVQRPCRFIPFGVDAVKFCPFPLQPKKSIDVYSIGRRSLVMHTALLELAEQKNFFYIYDTIKDLYMHDYKQHRSLYTNLVKRSRYLIANKAKFDLVNQTGGQEESGPRFFEGAAGGAVMLGITPNCEAYSKHFDWLDAVIQIPYEAANIADIIADLDAQPERLARIRTNNVINSLLRHDWVYRWREILETVGLEQTPEMASREAYLKDLAELASAEGTLVHS